jgi:hypothetical protein
MLVVDLAEAGIVSSPNFCFFWESDYNPAQTVSGFPTCL